MLLKNLVVVSRDNLSHVRHGPVGDLDGVLVNDLVEFVCWWYTLSNDLEKDLSNAGLDIE